MIGLIPAARISGPPKRPLMHVLSPSVRLRQSRRVLDGADKIDCVVEIDEIDENDSWRC